MIKRIVKKIVLWNKISLRNKNKIRRFFGKKVTRKASKKKKETPFTSLVNRFSVAKADFTHYEVALYFAGGMGNIYQVHQWIGPFIALTEQKKFLLIVRDKAVFAWLVNNTDFTIVYCLTIADLTNFYEENNLKCILYVNNGFKNFQSLMCENALHVHINHGESDKSSTATNQAKAYDYVFIVGQAGYDKYQSNLIKVDMKHFIKVGRPQLEHILEIDPFDKNQLPPIEIEKFEITEDEPMENLIVEEENCVVDRQVILYAPTWEATHESMNFTSLNEYGLILIEKLLNNPNYYVLYKPHPHTGSRDSIAKGINNQIKKMLKNHHKGEVVLAKDINSVYPHIDLAIFDNSAVAIDYLQEDKPMLMTDMFDRMDARQGKPTIVKGARLLSVQDLNNIEDIIKEEIENDSLKIIRNEVKDYFLGNYDYEKKESTQKFIETIVEICDERDRLYISLEEFNINKKGLESSYNEK